MFGFRNNKRRERYEENSSFPERIVIILTILVFAAVVLLCIFKFVFKEEAPEQITPEDYTQFSHENDFSRNVYGEVNTPNMENTVSDPDDPLPISCWGDSYTISSDYTTPSYVAYLSKNAIRICYNLGVGEGSLEDIAARQGGVPLYVAPMDIPARMNYREIAISNEYGHVPNIDFDKNSGFNPCKIAGIEGILSNFYGTYKFTRSASGFEQIVLEPTPVVTKAMELRRDDITVLFVGNVANLPDSAKTTDIYKKMVGFLNTDKYLVIGPIRGDINKVKEINSALAGAFGNKFLDLYSYLYNDAPKEYQISVNEKDKASIAAGNLPANYINNNSFSKQGAEIVGKKVSDTLAALKYYEQEKK